MKNIIKNFAENMTNESFTVFSHYQPKMPKSLMAKIKAENKKD